MGRRNRHHVVSRGYQRNFADGELVNLIDKQTYTYRPVGTADAFVERDFSSWQRPDQTWDDSLEDDWRRIEAATLPVTRRIGTSDERRGDREFVKPLMALHIARSYGFYQFHLRASDQSALEVGAAGENDPEMIAAFREKFGRDPLPAEIADLTRDAMEEIKRRRVFLIERMVYAYTWAVNTFLDSMKFQVLVAPGALEWVTGDSPVVVSDKKFFRFHSRGQVAMGDAEVAYMPLSRRVLIDGWKGDEARPDAVVDYFTCQKINWLMWRNCHRYVACHPSASPTRLLAGTRISGSGRH